MKRKPFASSALTVGILSFFALGALWGIDAGGARSFLRESALDLQLPYSREETSPPIVVVDIDSETLHRYGPWPWSRLLLARIIAALAEAGPNVVGLDILLEGKDRLSPASVARMLADETGRVDLATIARQLADGDAELGRALGRTQGVLGAVLAQQAAAYQAPAPILLRGAPRLPDIWGAEAAIGPMGGPRGSRCRHWPYRLRKRRGRRGASHAVAGARRRGVGRGLRRRNGARFAGGFSADH